MNPRHLHLGKSLLSRFGEHHGGRVLDMVETHGQQIVEAGPDFADTIIAALEENGTCSERLKEAARDLVALAREMEMH
jgi:hypothetical protein